MSKYHNPVMLSECIQELRIKPKGVYVDCTFGGGGHSREIIKNLSVGGRLFGFDQDKDALDNKIEDSKFTFIAQNFKFLKNYLKFYGVKEVDGILADLGVSSHQFDIPDRGFSNRFDGPLDMRMNTKQEISATEVVNTYEEEELIRILQDYGELNRSRRIAKEIIQARNQNPITTTEELKEIFKYIPEFKRNKFYAQLFQAIRMEVNDEVSVLKDLLLQSYEVLKPGGVLVVMSYHSIEDRLVKRFLKTGLFEGEPKKDMFGNWDKLWDLPFSKMKSPSEEEVKENSRSRSAKLRVGIKI